LLNDEYLLSLRYVSPQEKDGIDSYSNPQKHIERRLWPFSSSDLIRLSVSSKGKDSGPFASRSKCSILDCRNRIALCFKISPACLAFRSDNDKLITSGESEVVGRGNVSNEVVALRLEMDLNKWSMYSRASLLRFSLFCGDEGTILERDAPRTSSVRTTHSANAFRRVA
jgi:hypothetical protein